MEPIPHGSIMSVAGGSGSRPVPARLRRILQVLGEEQLDIGAGNFHQELTCSLARGRGHRGLKAPPILEEEFVKKIHM